MSPADPKPQWLSAHDCCLLIPETSQGLKGGVSLNARGICLGGGGGDLDLVATDLSSPEHGLAWKDTGLRNAKSTLAFSDLPELGWLAYMRWLFKTPEERSSRLSSQMMSLNIYLKTLTKSSIGAIEYAPNHEENENMICGLMASHSSKFDEDCGSACVKPVKHLDDSRVIRLNKYTLFLQCHTWNSTFHMWKSKCHMWIEYFTYGIIFQHLKRQWCLMWTGHFHNWFTWLDSTHAD